MLKSTSITAAAALALGLALAAPISASAAPLGALDGLKSAAPEGNVVQVRRGRGLALGILGAAAATAIIAGASRAHAYDDGYYYSRRHYRPRWSCWQLRDACDDGADWACRRFYNRCD